jgi:molybdenum cofactor cytidylyltransferase
MSIVGLLLAAGSARRFGAHKLLAEVADGIPVAAAAGAHLSAALPRSIGVVRTGDPEIRRLLTAAGLEVVENGRSACGMGTSIAAGVAAAPDADGWVIALGDMPWLRPETIRAVAGALAQGSSIAAPCINGVRGHPVGFTAQWRDELLALNGDYGARDLIASVDLKLIPTRDPGVIRDVDWPRDLTAG